MSYDPVSPPVVRTSASLTALDERLEEALQASGIGVWEWDLVTGQIRVSSAVGPLYGLQPGEGQQSVGIFVNDFVHPDDRPKLDAALDLLLNQDRPADLRFRALTADGGERLLDTHARVVRDREGRALRLVGVVHDAGHGDRRFRELADAAPVLMWATGPDLACTFFNAGYLRFTGRRLEDELGEGWRDLVHPDDAEVVRAADERASDGRAPFEARYRLRRHDGVYRWMQDSGIPVFSPDGSFAGLSGGMVDLHDVIEREVMLDGIFAGAPVGLALFDPDLRIRRVNDSYASLTGLPAADHAGRRVEEVLPGIAAAATAMLAQVLRTAEPATGVLVAEPADAGTDQARRFEASFIPLVLPGGEIAGLASMVNEVTERHAAEQRQAQLVRDARAAEEALRGQRDLYETLLTAQSEAGEAFVLFEGDRIAYANAAAERLTGRNVAELRELPHYLEMVPRARHEAVGAVIAEMVSGRAARTSFETDVQRPDGTIIAVEIAARALRGADGLRLVVLGRDVSGRKRVEQERERLLVAERSARREIEAAHGRASFLAKVSATLARSLRLSDGLHEVAELAVRDVADIVAIDVIPRRGDVIERAAVAALDGAARREMRRTLGRVRALDDANATAEAALTGQPTWVRDADSERLERTLGFGDIDDRLTRAVRIHACGIVPLIARGAVVGVLSLGWPRGRAEPGGAERELIDDFARRIALWIDNAQLYEEQAVVARTLQTALLPPELPTIDGIKLAARYLPADEASEVGGDFYDVFRAGEGWGVLVGDVCGKGAKAAAATALARYTVRASFAAGVAGPGQALALLDATLREEGDGERFVTAVLGVLEREGHGRVRLLLACGGHPSPIVLRADGRRELLDPEGRVIGIEVAGGWEVAEVTLGPGDAVLLYTDGVTEADRRDPLLPRELVDLLPPGTHLLEADGLADLLERIARERGGERLRDDVVVLAVKVDQVS